MYPREVCPILIVAAFLLLSGCANLKRDSYYFRFAGDRTIRSNAHIVKKETVYTVIEFLSEPTGVSVFAYDDREDQRGFYLGKTPFRYDAMAYNITNYADRTSEYDVEVFLPHIVTKTIDYSNPQNTSGELTFSVLIQKKGYESRIERVRVAATNEVLVKALVGVEIPSYSLHITLEK